MKKQKSLKNIIKSREDIVEVGIMCLDREGEVDGEDKKERESEIIASRMRKGST